MEGETHTMEPGSPPDEKEAPQLSDTQNLLPAALGGLLPQVLPQAFFKPSLTCHMSWASVALSSSIYWKN